MQYPCLSDTFLAQRLTHPGQGPLPVILDTDTANEIDDQFALTWAVLSPEAIALQAVTIAPYFNERSASPADGQQKSVLEARHVLEALGASHIPVVEGSSQYLPARGKAVESPAARELVRRAMQFPVEGPPLYVATIGCLSNVASAILMEPEIIRRIVVVMMAGNEFEWHTAREFNLQQDIPAGQVIFESGVPIIHLSAIRIALTLSLTFPEVKEYVRGCGEIGSLLAERYEAQCDLTPGYRRPIWDLAAIAWLINPAWAPSALCPRPTLTDEGFWSNNDFGALIRRVIHLDTSAIYMDLFKKLAALKE